MPGIDEARGNLLHEIMSRPFRHFLPAACAAISLSFSACVGTLYDPMYSYRNTHYRKPPERKEASAADVLKSLESNKRDGLPPEGLPPAPAEVPGLPPAMGDPAVPAIPGLPPAAPPPVPPPAT